MADLQKEREKEREKERAREKEGAREREKRENERQRKSGGGQKEPERERAGEIPCFIININNLRNSRQGHSHTGKIFELLPHCKMGWPKNLNSGYAHRKTPPTTMQLCRKTH